MNLMPGGVDGGLAEEADSAFRNRGFRTVMLRWTAAYWIAIFALFTLRSIATPRPHLEIQAGLRLIMMLVGFAMAATLLEILRRLDIAEWPRRFASYALLGLTADLAYVLVNYLVFYVVPGLWTAEHGAVAKIASYMVEFFWLFPGWLLFCEVVFRRYASKSGSTSGPDAESLWIGSRGHRIRLSLDEIDWLEAEGDYVRIHAGERSFLQRSTMAKMEAWLARDRFLRIHRGIIIAMRMLKAVRRKRTGRLTVALANGRELAVGRSYARRVRDLAGPFQHEGADV